MNKLSFLGETPSLALNAALKECGEDAIVLSTKKISNATKTGKDMYEVIVAIEDSNSPTKNSFYDPKYEEYAKANKIEIQKKLDEKNYNLKDEFNSLKNELLEVKRTLWSPKSQLYDLTIPLEFAEIYSLFERNEFDQEMTYTIMKKTIEELPIVLRSNPKKIKDFFKLILRRVVPVKNEIPLRENQRKIIMMVGPTGVGKTTTISKLAARYAYKLGQNYKVGVITLDSFRVGALEQLQAYTNIMRLPLEIVKKPEEFPEAILRLKDCNYIFIDTAGSSQYDIDKIEMINSFQKTIEDEIPIEKNLVLPANVKQSDLQDIYKSYIRLGIDFLTFTKLDETKSFGNLISFAHKTKKSITYFSIGQNVPDDLIIADQTFLIDCFMNNKCPRK